MIIHAPSEWERAEPCPVLEYVTRELDGSDYDSGQLEAIERGNANAHRAIGRLLDLLASKGMITGPEIADVVGCHSPRATLTAEPEAI